MWTGCARGIGPRAGRRPVVDLAVMRLEGDGGVNPLAGFVHGAGDGQPAAATHVLAINGDERIGLRPQVSWHRAGIALDGNC